MLRVCGVRADEGRERMNRDALEQYCAIRKETKDLRRRIEEGEKMLDRMREEGCQVSDTVRGTRKDGTIGPIKITGFPIPEYTRIENMTKKRNAKLKVLEEDLLDALNAVDDFINAIPKSELRMMFRFYYLDDMMWYQVAKNMNAAFPKKRIKYTADSCRMAHNRYLEKNL